MSHRGKHRSVVAWSAQKAILTIHTMVATLLSVMTHDRRWGPKADGLSSADYLKAAQLGQKVSIGLEMAYQVQLRSGIVAGNCNSSLLPSEKTPSVVS